MGRFKYVFVHGLSGWGSYDDAYRRIPYWGMRGGDLMSFLREKGFDCYAASVSPAGSAWDRACELYAQITGTRVDYGEAHSLKYRHERYGRDYSEHPLIPARDEHSQLVLLGHSFGGTTVRLFSELLAHGDAGERLASSPGNLSPLFIGGMENRVHSLVTLATPMNGITAYDLFTDADFDPESVKTPWWSHGLAMGTKPRMDGRDERDYANYDMQIDHAHELNRLISTLPHVYYLSVPCSMTVPENSQTGHINRKRVWNLCLSCAAARSVLMREKQKEASSLIKTGGKMTGWSIPFPRWHRRVRRRDRWIKNR